MIYNGIALADFATEASAASSNLRAHPRPYVLALGRFVPQKGFDLLIHAWKRAGLREFDLVIAGDGPEKTALQNAAHGLDHVHFWGRADRADVVQLLRGCRVVCAALAR